MNLNKLDQQKRIILAVVLSFLFFVVYGEFFVKKPLKNDQNLSLEANKSTNNAELIQKSSSTNTQNASLNLAPNSQKKIIAKISSPHFEAQIDALGRISSFILKDSKFQDENKAQINLIPQNAAALPLELRFEDSALHQKAFSTDYSSDKNELFIDENTPVHLKLTQNLGDLSVEKHISFYSQGNYEVSIQLSKNSPYFVALGSRPNVAVDSYTVHGALTLDKKDLIEIFEDKDVKKDEHLEQIVLASAFDRYYTSLFYNFNEPLNIIVTKDNQGDSLIFAKADNTFKSGAYIGAKEHNILKNIDERLLNAIEYGWFTFIAKPMFWFLDFLHNYIGNWGWAIVVLVLVIRIILFPLTYKSMISMNKLKDLAPKMKELRDKYKDQPQKMNMQMMELYKKHGANPFSGCLPILLQIPIFFAIYRVLLNAVELKAAPWAFWIEDLSLMDPYFILPILMGATMFIQQLITPMAIQDPTQAKIMKFLPVIFTFFFLFFPAGLTLYWCTNNLCSLVQQWVVNKLFAKEHHKNKEVKDNEN